MKTKKASLPLSEEFMKMAKARWGRRWRMKAAEYLNVNPTTVWRWTQKNGNPPWAAMMVMRSGSRRVDKRRKAA